MVATVGSDSLKYNNPQFLTQSAMEIPSQNQRVDPDNIEAHCVCSFFLGKTADEAYEMYRSEEFFPSGFEAFSNLSIRGLEYYLPPAVRYVESNASVGNGDFVRGLLSSLSDHLYANPIKTSLHPSLPRCPLPPQIVDSIRRVADFVRFNLRKFDLDENDVAIVLKEIDGAPPQ